MANCYEGRLGAVGWLGDPTRLAAPQLVPDYHSPYTHHWFPATRFRDRDPDLRSLVRWEEIWPGPAMKLVGPLAAR